MVMKVLDFKSLNVPKFFLSFFLYTILITKAAMKKSMLSFSDFFFSFRLTNLLEIY